MEADSYINITIGFLDENFVFDITLSTKFAEGRQSKYKSNRIIFADNVKITQELRDGKHHTQKFGRMHECSSSTTVSTILIIMRNQEITPASSVFTVKFNTRDGLARRG